MTIYNLQALEPINIVILDDEPAIAEFIGETMAENGYSPTIFTNPKDAIEILTKDSFDLAFIDINMPEINGIEISKTILKHSPETEIVIITGVPDEKNLDPCLKLGLTQFLFKPFTESQLIYTAYAALHFKRLRKSKADAIKRAKVKHSGFIGISQDSIETRKEIQAIADTKIPVLILGDSGTGKEVVARDLHNNSSRHKKSFLPINCAVLGSLAETELFGHVSGAFTGASKTTQGYIGTTEGGTLFFDEIGELPLDVQAKLLRFLDNGEYSKVGEAVTRHADIRVVAATNRDLEQMCKENRFREDLYYRLSGSVIKTTPLDTRKADIVPLIYHFLEVFTQNNSKQSKEITSDAVSLLVEAEWPGNVRQLRQTLFKIYELTPSSKISTLDVRKVLGNRSTKSLLTYKEQKEIVLNNFEKAYFLEILSLAQGSLKKALEVTGMHKKNFYVKIKKLGLSLKDYIQP